MSVLIGDTDVQALVAKIKGSDLDARAGAINEAAPLGAPAIAPLAGVAGGGDRGAAKAAREAIQRVAYYATRPGAGEDERAVAAELLKLIGTGRSRAVRAEAIRLVGILGGPDAATPLQRLLFDPDVREEARLALIRLPGPTADAALHLAMRTAPEDFRPALDLALQQRRRRAAGEGK